MQENKNQNNQTEELDINNLMQIRRDKLKELQDQGKDPYEITKFNRTNTAGQIKANYEEFEQKDAFPIILFAIILPATETSFPSNSS